MNKCVSFLALAFLAVSVQTASLPSSIPICKLSQSDFKKCLADSVNIALPLLAKGNKDLKMPKIDPLLIPSIHIAGNGGQVDLEQTYTDLNVHGLSLSKIESADFDPKECVLNIEAVTEKVEMKSHLKVGGKMLLFTLNGNGKSNVIIHNLKSKLVFPCTREERDGKKYLKIHDAKIDFVPEKLSFDIENLIDGNKQLSDEVLKVMNENDQEIFKELKKDYEASFAQVFTQLANIVFGKIPEDELFPQ